MIAILCRCRQRSDVPRHLTEKMMNQPAGMLSRASTGIVLPLLKVRICERHAALPVALEAMLGAE